MVDVKLGSVSSWKHGIAQKWLRKKHERKLDMFPHTAQLAST